MEFGLFLLAAFIGKLLIDDVLIQRVFHLASRCYICNKASDPLQHVFVDCPCAQAIWNLIALQSGCSVDIMGYPFICLRLLWMLSLVRILQNFGALLWSRFLIPFVLLVTNLLITIVYPQFPVPLFSSAIYQRR